MSVWLLQRPPSINDRHERFLIRVERDQPETTPHALLAMRFDTATAARRFAVTFDGAVRRVEDRAAMTATSANGSYHR